MPQRLASFVAALLLLTAGWPVGASAPLRPGVLTVGNGDPATCTQAALFHALDQGGSITFNCGSAPKVILLNAARIITVTASLNGGNLITLSGNNSTRLFQVAPGFSLTLSRITISNGFAPTDGGAIRTDPNATLVIDQATFRHNQTDPAYSGGAIFNRGNLTISNSTFDSNSAGNGGALDPRDGTTTTIRNTVFIHNSTTSLTDGWGGAILAWNLAAVNVSDSQFLSNTARWGGALYVFANSSLTLTNSLLSANLADSGPSADAGGGAIYNNARLVLAGTTLQDNVTSVPAGFGFTGIRAGGAIWNSSGGSLQLTGGALRRNRALRGGALYSLGNATVAATTLADNLAGRGGAIENANYTDNSLSITASTLSDNEVSSALYPAITTPLGSAIFNTAHLDLTNSTLSGNSGKTALQEDNSVITLTNVTLAQNPDGGLGSDQSPNTSQVRLFNTVLAGNGGHDCGLILFGTFVSQHGLSSDATCATWTGGQNNTGVDPQLSLLGYHGGPTLTHMLAAASPAVDAGAGCPSSDQRGVSRPQGPACDLGAVERQSNDGFFWLFLPLTRK